MPAGRPSLYRIVRHALAEAVHTAAARAVYPRAAIGAVRRRADFDAVERFCLFLGYPRSGHTLVGAMLTAHPHAVIAHELNVLRYVALGYSRNQIFSLLVDRDRWFVNRKCEWTGYSYAIPGQWQGRYTTLRVIGDKKGAATTRLVGRRPALLDDLRRTVGVPLRIVHVTRNPFDNIAAMAVREGNAIGRAAAAYFALCDTVRDTLARCDPSEVVHVRHEDIIRAPVDRLATLCRFLDLETPAGYLEDAARIVFASPSRSRRKVSYSDETRARIQARLAEYTFLEGYRAND